MTSRPQVRRRSEGVLAMMPGEMRQVRRLLSLLLLLSESLLKLSRRRAVPLVLRCSTLQRHLAREGASLSTVVATESPLLYRCR